MGLMIWLSACGAEEKAKDGKQTSGSADAQAVSGELETFLSEAPKLDVISFDNEWYYNTDPEQAKPISKELRETFIGGNTVQEHPFTFVAATELSADTEYFYVSQGPKTEQYRSMIFSTLSTNQTLTYFCTYSLEGHYIDGIVIHAFVGKENDRGLQDFFERQGGFKSDDFSTIMVKDKIPGTGSPITLLELNEEGKIIQRSKA